MENIICSNLNCNKEATKELNNCEWYCEDCYKLVRNIIISFNKYLYE